MNLSNGVALITGGGTGIGRAVAEALASEGAQVIITGRREFVFRETAEAIHGEKTVLYRSADTSDAKQVEDLVKWVEEDVGPISILVNNAGVNILDRQLSALSVDDWDYVMRVNANGVFYMVKSVLPAMRERGHGDIVNISSMAGLRGYAIAGAAYSASKHAMNALTQVITEEEAANGIRATSICPGPVNTPILDQRPEPVAEEEREVILQPEDVAAAVMLVVSLPRRAHIPELHITPAVD